MLPDNHERARKLDNHAVVDLVKAMFQALKEDYIAALNYLEKHPDEPIDSKQKQIALALKKDCEDFTKTELYEIITDVNGDALLRHFRKVG